MVEMFHFSPVCCSEQVRWRPVQKITLFYICTVSSATVYTTTGSKTNFIWQKCGKNSKYTNALSKESQAIVRMMNFKNKLKKTLLVLRPNTAQQFCFDAFLNSRLTYRVNSGNINFPGVGTPRNSVTQSHMGGARWNDSSVRTKKEKDILLYQKKMKQRN